MSAIQLQRKPHVRSANNCSTNEGKDPSIRIRLSNFIAKDETEFWSNFVDEVKFELQKDLFIVYKWKFCLRLQFTIDAFHYLKVTVQPLLSSARPI